MFHYLFILLGCCMILGLTMHRLTYLGPTFPDVEGVTSLSRLLSEAQTGDLILFSGNGRDSCVVKAWSGCLWSHVGMVIVDPQTGIRYLYNADGCSSRRDVTTGEYKEGIQMNDLEVYIRSYPGNAFYCPLLTKYKKPDLSRLESFIKCKVGTEFNHDWFELLRCTSGKGGGLLGSRAETVDSFFCSQLVAWLYYLMGVMGDKIPFNEYHPSSFIRELEGDWINGFSPGPLLWIYAGKSDI